MNTYLAPAITRHTGRANGAGPNLRHAGRPASTAQATLDGVEVSQLVAQFGSPLFVFSEQSLRERARALQDAFRSRHPETIFAWSYKTNYLGAICRVFHSEGWFAEVVSDFEYEKARGLGMEGPQIVLNGPHKPRAILERAVAEGAMIQADNWDELEALESIAAERGRPVEIALRVWLDAGVRPLWSKFGFGFETGEAWRAVRHIQRSGRLRLRGFHTHIGTYILDPGAYRMAVDKLITLAERLRVEYGRVVDYLNLGGGFASRSTLHYSYYAADQAVPSLDRYAEAICPPLLALPREHRPKLVLETGRALVDEAGHLVTTVVAVKSGAHPADSETPSLGTKAPAHAVAHDGPGVIVDAGIHLLYTGAWYRFHVRPAQVRPHDQPVAVKLYGCLCMNIDVLREQVLLPPVRTGDHLILHPVGAYNVTQSMQFITYRPAVVLIGANRTVDLIRRRESLADIDRLESVPSRLAAAGHEDPSSGLSYE